MHGLEPRPAEAAALQPPDGTNGAGRLGLGPDAGAVPDPCASQRAAAGRGFYGTMRSVKRFWDRHGAPMSYEDWGDAYNTEPPPVARTTVGEVLVSTMWVGSDTCAPFRLKWWSPPLIFETQVFGIGWWDTAEWSATEAAAVAVHEQMVARVRSTLAPAGP